MPSALPTMTVGMIASPSNPSVRLTALLEPTITSQLTTGVAYYRPVGVEHNVINPGDTEFVFVEIEIKA